MAANGLLAVLLTCFALGLLVLAGSIMVGDSWMTLVAGREIWQHGFVTRESLTVFALGREWIDQQWLAQLLFYGAHELGGLRLVLLLDVTLVVAAYAVAAVVGRRAATERGTLIVLVLAIVASPWAWNVRAQAPSLLLFALTLALLVGAQRTPAPTRRVLLVLPLLCVWANVHGSVVLGALLVAAAGALDLVRRRGSVAVSLALLIGGPLAVLASPYAAELPGYYRLMLFELPLQEIVTEWAPTRPEARTAVFFALAALTAVLAVWQRRKLTLFEVVALALTVYVAVDAIRGVVWFSLTAAMLVPRLLDGATGWRRPAPRRALNLLIGSVCGLALAIGVGVVASRSSSWFEREWPVRALPTLARVTENPAVRVYSVGKYADWALWRRPSLRGRVAYDVRFELYTRRRIVTDSRFTYMEPGWQRAPEGFEVVLVDPARTPRQARALADLGGEIAYEDDLIAIVTRPA